MTILELGQKRKDEYKKAKLIGIIIISLLVLIIFLQNTQSAETKLLFVTVRMPIVIMLMLTVLTGFIARVNTLTFKKAEQTPKMGIEVASIAKKGKSAGFLGWIKGTIANLFIKPPKVDKLGNTTMLEFGDALLQKNSMFTFPKAKNIKESKVVAIGQTQK